MTTRNLMTCLLGLTIMVLVGGCDDTPEAANLSVSPPGLDGVISAYGTVIDSGALFDMQSGDGTGSCPDSEDGSAKCTNFYAWASLVQAITDYNQGNPSTPFLDDGTTEKAAMTLAAFLANTYYETASYTACKERLTLADGTCSAAMDTGGCSGGKIGDYTSAKAPDEGFTVTTCGGLTAPTNGCTSFWGTQLTAEDCWFGRGALQISWPGNYSLIAARIEAAGAGDICADPDLICKNAFTAWSAALAYWVQNQASWTSGANAYSFKGALEVVRPADSSTNEKRESLYNSFLQTMNITPTEGTPTVTTASRCGIDWADANSSCSNTLCPGDTDNECPMGQMCFAEIPVCSE